MFELHISNKMNDYKLLKDLIKGDKPLKYKIIKIIQLFVDIPLDMLYNQLYSFGKWIFPRIYFTYKRVHSLGIFQFTHHFYNGIINLFGIFIGLFIIYAYIFNNKNILFLNDLWFILTNLSDNAIGVCGIFLIIILLKYLSNIIKIIYIYIITWRFFFTTLLLMTYYQSYNNIILDSLYLFNLLSYTLLLIVLGGFIKGLINDEKRIIKNSYFTYNYDKLYNKTLKELVYNKGISYNNHYQEHRKIFLDTIKNYKVNGNIIIPILDRPIHNGEDIFDNKKISHRLYNLISGLDTKSMNHSYSIGIVGEWGIGKTSVINILEQEYLYGKLNFVVHKFTPWNYDKTDLIKKFFDELSVLVGSKTLSYQIGNYLKVLGTIDKSLGLSYKLYELFYGQQTLDELKSKINASLSKLDHKLIIILDDIDRCEPDEVITILNIIKNLGDFNNIIYLVSYDKEHILNILKDKKIDSTYIDKIINLETYVPAPNKKQIIEYFTKKLNRTLDIIGITDLEVQEFLYKFTNDNYSFIFANENLRFIKKFLNQVDIILQLNGKDNIKFIEQNFHKILLINYVKLKDYQFFTDSLNMTNIIKDNLLNLTKDNIPQSFIDYDSILYKNPFLREMGLGLSKNDKNNFNIVNLNKKNGSFLLNIENTKKILELFT